MTTSRVRRKLHATTQLWEVVHEVRRASITTAERVGDALHHDRTWVSPRITTLEAVDVLDRIGGDEKGEVILHPGSGYLAGCVVDGSQATAAACGPDFAVLGETQLELGLNLDEYFPTLKRLAELIDRTIELAQVDTAKLTGVALCLPAPLYRETPDELGQPWSRAILARWQDKPVAGHLHELLFDRGLRPFRVVRDDTKCRRFVTVENDASAGALGVYTGALRIRYGPDQALRKQLPAAIDDLLYVHVGRGSGSGWSVRATC